MKANVISIISLLCLVLTGCAFSTEEAQDKKAKDTVDKTLEGYKEKEEQRFKEEGLKGNLTEENINIAFFETERPGEYRVKVTWPSSVNNMLFDRDGQSKTFFNGEFYEGLIFHGESTVLSLTSREAGGSVISTKVLVVQAPKDLIVDRNLQLQEDTEFKVNRVFFMAGKKIITSGHSLTITANKLYVQDAQSEEYPSGINIYTASLNDDDMTELKALSGSKISISARNAIGTLRIAAIGFDGRDGVTGDELNRRNGVDPYAINPVLKGADGQAGIIEAVAEVCVHGSGNIDRPCERKRLLCKQQPTSGQNGKPGAKGTTGEAGQKGGNTGDVYVTISEPSDLVVKVWHKSGKGGRGGEGAPGFVGGPGGKAGDRAASVCQSARDGQQGPQGPQGDKGLDGEPGEIGRVQVSGARVDTIPL